MHAYDIICRHIWRHNMHMMSYVMPYMTSNILYDVICDVRKLKKSLILLDPLLTTKNIWHHCRCYDVTYHVICNFEAKRDRNVILREFLMFLDPLLTTNVLRSHTDVMMSDMIIVVFTHFVVCDQLCWNNAFRHIWRHISITVPFIICIW